MKLVPLLAALFAAATPPAVPPAAVPPPAVPPAGGRAPAARVEENPAAPGLVPSPALVRRLEKARAAKGPGFHPHTRHLDKHGRPLFTNRLILESSPYLLQHANNPVSWYAWGDEPFARAAREHKPVLLSVGYSTCHWCHVMERESFEDPEVARLLNERFIAIKVDREERPDVDGVYLTAVQLLTGSGGWPMTCVLTPDRKPFFGGTYFPRGPFLDALKRLRRAYDAEPERVARVARELTRAVQSEARPPSPKDLPGPEALGEAVEKLARAYDPVNGGFGEAPRFPLPVNLELLLRFHRRTGDAPALQMAVRTLETMARGGIYDQLGGGFHRYSTDARWLKPHFEKMLYDNAQLAEVYLEAWQLTGRADFARVVRETLDFVARDLADPRGGFWSASDADSPGPAGEELEGGFFTWTPGEIEAVLGKAEGAGVAAAYGVTAEGDIEGRGILRRIGEVSADARQRLFEARRRRAPPAVDRKIVTSWNGLLISALAKAGFALGEPRYTALAVAAAGFLLRHPGAHTWSEGRSQEEGYLDDGAALSQGLLDLYEATHELRWLQQAIALQRVLDARFHDPAAGGYFLTPAGKQGLIAREKPAEDGVVPSGNSIAARNLLRLAELTGDARFRRRAEEILRAFSSRLQAMPALLGALGWTLGQPLEVVVVRPASDPAAALVDVLRRTFLPDAVRAVAAEGPELQAQLRLVPLFEGRRALHGKATAYVCRSQVCDLPTSDPATLAKQLARIEPSSAQ